MGRWLAIGLVWGAVVVSGGVGRAAHREVALTVPTSGRVGFTEILGATTGVSFANQLSEERALRFSILNNGSGVAVGDVDGDGRPDLYFCGLDCDNALYRNLGGWRFQELTPESGTACPDQASTGAVFVDVEADGDLDLLVNGIGAGTRLWMNDGHGRFREREDSGFRRTGGATSFAVADVDGDSDLDVYVTCYRTETIQDLPGTRFSLAKEGGGWVVRAVDGRPATGAAWRDRLRVNAAGEVIEMGESDILYLNDGTGRFAEAAWTDGRFLDEDGQPLREPPGDWGLSAMFRDLNWDGRPDLYVCNDAESPDRIWMNQGQGRFRAMAEASLRVTSLSSMGVDFADVDRDGDDDFIVVDMLARQRQRRQTQRSLVRPLPESRGLELPRLQVPRNTFFLDRGDGSYVEAAQMFGVHATDWSWTPIFLDVDLDGYEDLIVANGFHRDVRDQDHLERLSRRPASEELGSRDRVWADRRGFPSWPTASAVLRNEEGQRFVDRTTVWGWGGAGIAQGMALADLDGDGDLDGVINRMNEPAALLRNEADGPRVAVRVRGSGRNRDGVGARVEYTTADLRQGQEIIAGGRYLSDDDGLRCFAFRSGTNLLRVFWPGGHRSEIRNVRPNVLYEIGE